MSSQLLIYALWATAASVVGAAIFCARLIVRPGRTRAWSSPRELGLAYDDVAFRSSDGVRLTGWFIPAPAQLSRPAPAVVTVHGWPWCRMGTQARSILNDLPGSRKVDLLPLMQRLHDDGYHVLAFDQRNFGDSDANGVVGCGLHERQDVVGALDYLGQREDVDAGRMGSIGFSMGAVSLMFAASQTNRVKAAIAVQPTTPSVFMKGYTWTLLGPFALLVAPLAELFYRVCGGPALSSIQPALAVASAQAPFLFIQGSGDRWGSTADVQRMAAAAPHSSTLFPETRHRFEGYQWVMNHLDIVTNFFRTHLIASAAPPPIRERRDDPIHADSLTT